MKKPCKKCLLENMELDAYTKSVLDYVKSIPSENKVSDEVYRKRLEICLGCDELSNGICAKCGCFVELRAAKHNAYCASEYKFW